MPAISAYVNSSTSRSHTASRNASGSVSSAACRSSRTVARSRICSGVSSAAGPSPPDAASSTRGLSISTASAPRRGGGSATCSAESCQPRLQVRSRREAVRKPQRLHERVLHQISASAAFRVSRRRWHRAAPETPAPGPQPCLAAHPHGRQPSPIPITRPAHPLFPVSPGAEARHQKGPLAHGDTEPLQWAQISSVRPLLAARCAHCGRQSVSSKIATLAILLGPDSRGDIMTIRRRLGLPTAAALTVLTLATSVAAQTAYIPITGRIRFATTGSSGGRTRPSTSSSTTTPKSSRTSSG